MEAQANCWEALCCKHETSGDPPQYLHTRPRSPAWGLWLAKRFGVLEMPPGTFKSDMYTLHILH